MPGPVIDGHADLEGQCTNCHQRFQKETQPQLCLGCHEDVAADIERSRGFHGQAPAVRDAECKTCHTEHKGRAADIVQLDRETFHHEWTDYPLEGAHRQVRCDACHASDLKYREAPSECIDCHREDDAHRGQLGEACADCHTVVSWREAEAEFDHEATDFPLRGRHRDAQCGSCHINERYTDLPTRCYDCHRLDDAHRGTRGTKCDSCHTPRDWETVTFDHDRDTEFALEGRHDEIACGDCHKETPYEKLEQECYACHRNEDEHRGRHGKECDACHTPTGWADVSFDHDKETDFPLRGKHIEVHCDACHRGPIYEEELATDCYACHRADDSHAGQQGTDCGRCHSEQGWPVSVLFDHDVTRFPLIGLHAVVPCEGCHLTSAFHDAPSRCVDCHTDDDVHDGTLGRDCESCHSPNGWPLWEFDHNTETDFVLDGSHEGLACDACHRTTVATHSDIALAGSCGECHREDDVHQGRFGRNCQRCHTTESFQEVSIGNQRLKPDAYRPRSER